jgi:hypothetical protein
MLPKLLLVNGRGKVPIISSTGSSYLVEVGLVASPSGGSHVADDLLLKGYRSIKHAKDERDCFSIIYLVTAMTVGVGPTHGMNAGASRFTQPLTQK